MFTKLSICILPSLLGLSNTPNVPLQRGNHFPNEYLRSHTKPSDDEDSVMELGGIWSTLSLLLLPRPL